MRDSEGELNRIRIELPDDERKFIASQLAKAKE